MEARIKNSWTEERFFVKDLLSPDGKNEIVEARRVTTRGGDVSWSFHGYKLRADGERRANASLSDTQLFLDGDDEARLIVRMLILLEEV